MIPSREVQVTTIKKARIEGKWLEVWTNEKEGDFNRTEESDNWDWSSKAYMFDNALEQAGLLEHVFNHGVVGLKVTREFDGSNYEISKVEKP